MKPIDVLLVESDEDVRRSFSAYLRTGGLIVNTETNAFAAIRKLEKVSVLVVVSGQTMPGPSGSKLLETVRARWPKTGRVLFSDSKDLEREALKVGALLLSRLSGNPTDWRRAIIAEVQDAEARHRSAV